MEIEKLPERKERLESDISFLISQFQTETKGLLVVTNIRLVDVAGGVKVKLEYVDNGVR